MQAKALLEFPVKLFLLQRDDTRGLAAFLGPTSDDRFPVSGRIANGPAGRNMFFGAAAMIALMPTVTTMPD